jgi:biotin synthase
MQPLALFPANSIFTSGYLTTGGNTPQQDFEMIRDLGFELEVADGVTAAPVARPQLSVV